MKLSIIIPIYNTEKYLRSCLDSVICPEMKDYEIIAVNDGSTDSSPAILAEYAARYPGLVHPVTTANGGLGHARNTGLALAKGEYVQFLDSDDTLAPNAVAEILALLGQDFDICLYDVVSVDEAGKQLSYERGCAREGTFCLSEYPGLLLEMPNACSKIWRRQLFTETGIHFPDRMWFEDLATIPRLYLHAGTILYMPRAWYLYLQRSGSITNTRNPQRNLEIIKAMDMVLDYYKKTGNYERYRDELCGMAAYHQLITTTTRVNLTDPSSGVQELLLNDFLDKFPDYRANPYLKKQSRKYRLLRFLIIGRHRRALNLLMRLNNRIKRKNV